MLDKSLLDELITCRLIVDEYTDRIDNACARYYTTGQTLFPDLLPIEDENISQTCNHLISQLKNSNIKDAYKWDEIKFPLNQYEEQIERTRNYWIRRRNLLRTIENQIKKIKKVPDQVFHNSKSVTKNNNSTEFMDEPPAKIKYRRRIEVYWRKHWQILLWAIVLFTISVIFTITR